MTRLRLARRRRPGRPGAAHPARAARALAQADLVLYDALVSPELLALAPQRAALLRRQARRPPLDAAGDDPRADDPRARAAASASCGSSAATRSCSAAAARKRWRSRAAGVPYEVVPGVSSAVAAPALAGHPGHAPRPRRRRSRSSRGHAESACAAGARAASRRGAATVVVLMGLGARAARSRAPGRARLAPATPAAILLGRVARRARTPGSARSPTLAGSRSPPALEDAPGTIVVGDVVGVSPRARRCTRATRRRTVWHVTR